VKTYRAGDILALERRPVTVDPLAEYQEIGVRSFGKGIFHKEPLRGADLGNKRVFEIQPGDLILNNVFAWEGAVALAGPMERGKIGSHRFMTYVANPAVADPRYLKYFFVSEPGLALLRQASPGSAGRNRTLAIDRFAEVQVHLPALDVQRLAADRLDALTDRAGRAIRLADRSAALMRAIPAALGRRSDLEPAAKRRLGWREVRLGEVMRLSQEAQLVGLNGTYPNVGVLSFGRGLFEKPPIDGASTRAVTLYRIRAKQFVYSRLFAFEGAYALVPRTYDGYYVSNEFPTFDIETEQVLPGFLAAYFKSPALWAELASGSKGLGLRRQRVHPERVLQHSIWLPPIPEQGRVATSCERIDSCLALRESADDRIQALLPSVLNRVFSADR
jgi:type I restriction enzyme, S subunit